MAKRNTITNIAAASFPAAGNVVKFPVRDRATPRVEGECKILEFPAPGASRPHGSLDFIPQAGGTIIVEACVAPRFIFALCELMHASGEFRGVAQIGSEFAGRACFELEIDAAGVSGIAAAAAAAGVHVCAA